MGKEGIISRKSKKLLGQRYVDPGGRQPRSSALLINSISVFMYKNYFMYKTLIFCTSKIYIYREDILIIL